MKMNQWLKTAFVTCAAVFTFGIGLSAQATTANAKDQPLHMPSPQRL